MKRTPAAGRTPPCRHLLSLTHLPSLIQEPDGERFWNSSSAAFYVLFDTTARALKAYDSTLIVGGPGVSNTLSPQSAPFAFGLLDFVAAHGTPLDFYSWHRYGTNALHPAGYDTTAAAVRAALDSRGLTATRQHVTEWAPSILGAEAVTNGPLAAAYTAAAMIYLAAHSDVDVAIFYPLCEGEGADGSWGLFEDDGAGTAPKWRRQGRAYEAVAATLRDTPTPLVAGFVPEPDYAVIGGVASGTARGALLRVSAVVAAQTTSESGGFALTASAVGWAPSGSATISIYLIDAAHPFDVVLANATLPVAEDGSVSVALAQFAPPAVAWVVIDAAAA